MNATKAIHRMRAVIRRQPKALATEDAYVHWLGRYIAALRTMPSNLPSERKLERFLTDLALKRHVAAATQNQAFNAIVFFYKDILGKPLQNVDALRAQRPASLRHAPTIEETRALLQAVRDVYGYPTRLVACLLYGCGLRVSEPLNLRVKDLNLSACHLVIRGAKGGHDRVVALPACLIPGVKAQLAVAHGVWKQDREEQIPVALPPGLARKYPEYQLAWPWAWVFPSHTLCRHPRTGQTVRYRMHEVNVQRAIKTARRRLGIMVLPHELRHAYATHCLERGTNPRAIQEAMGHKSLETTMGYLHAESLSVHSPLELTTGAPPGGLAHPRRAPTLKCKFHP